MQNHHYCPLIFPLTIDADETFLYGIWAWRQEGLKETFLLAQHCDQRPNDLACISIDVADDELQIILML